MNIDIDDDWARKAGIDRQTALELLAVAVYKHKGIHSTMAGRLVGISQFEFHQLLGKYSETINYSVEDFEDDIKTLDEVFKDNPASNNRFEPRVLSDELASDKQDDMAALSVVNAVHLTSHILRIEFSNGEQRVLDFAPFIFTCGFPEVAPYKKEAAFRQFEITDGTLVWGDHAMVFPVEDLYRGRL